MGSLKRLTLQICIQLLLVGRNCFPLLAWNIIANLSLAFRFIYSQDSVAWLLKSTYSLSEQYCILYTYNVSILQFILHGTLNKKIVLAHKKKGVSHKKKKKKKKKKK